MFYWVLEACSMEKRSASGVLLGRRFPNSLIKERVECVVHRWVRRSLGGIVVECDCAKERSTFHQSLVEGVEIA